MGKREKILVLFPGSRKTEIERNFPLQVAAARQIASLDAQVKIAVSISQPAYEETLRNEALDLSLEFFPCALNYAWMQKAQMAIATSGTVTLELALHETPTLVTFAIRPLDVFIAQKIFRINLPHYCIVNIIVSKDVFPEFFGPNLTKKSLIAQSYLLWNSEALRSKIALDCEELRKSFGIKEASREAASEIISIFGSL